MTTFFVNAIFVLTRKIVKMTRKVEKTKILGGGGYNWLPLNNRVKEHRARLNVNQGELGKLAGVSRQTISLIERGDYSPSVTLALKLARIFEVPVEEIFTYTDEEEDS